jgi:hypothetical protein
LEAVRQRVHLPIGHGAPVHPEAAGSRSQRLPGFESGRKCQLGTDQTTRMQLKSPLAETHFETA